MVGSHGAEREWSDWAGPQQLLAGSVRREREKESIAGVLSHRVYVLRHHVAMSKHQRGVGLGLLHVTFNIFVFSMRDTFVSPLPTGKYMF